MLTQEPPVYIISPGRVYRRDLDPTHTPMFHQVEGLAVDKGLTLGHLKGTLTAMARHVFGDRVRLRLRPSYFQFTEPSVEQDVSCFVCDGRDPNCKVCKGAGWLEMGGAGMVDPAVLTEVGYDPEEYTGFAFGMGPDRMAMVKYGVPDLRLFFEGEDRQSTRLNSSHANISYAVFCLKKQNKHSTLLILPLHATQSVHPHAYDLHALP